MPTLLDTHTLLWFLTDDRRLGPRARSLIRSEPVVAWSSISRTEIAIKRMLGKLSVPDGFDTAVADVHIVPLEYTHADAIALDSLPQLSRHDPFDRMLAAQAVARGLRLLTADPVLLRLESLTAEDAGI